MDFSITFWEVIFLSTFVIKSSFSTIPVAVNEIKSINVSCNLNNLNATLTFQNSFKGIVFAKQFSQDCKSFGSSLNFIDIALPTNGCGIRLLSKNDEQDKELYYDLTLVIQQDKFLRQVSDQEKTIKCFIPKEAFTIKSKSMENIIQNNLVEKYKNYRQGRQKNEGWSKEDLIGTEVQEKLNEALESSKAWMEIIPNEIHEKNDLKVGETANIVVKTTLPVGIDWRLTNCLAHDGLGDSSQKLLNEQGCPLDDLLSPPKMGTVKSISLMKHQEVKAEFIAFKFPDRDRLHFICEIQLCKGKCPYVNCLTASNATFDDDNRVGRNLADSPFLDQIDVFNSVEVLAPEIDQFRKNIKYNQLEDDPFANIPGNKKFCVSLNRMAIAFCILGLIFLGAVIIATLSLMKARRTHGGSLPSYYSKSLFSSTSGSGSAYGSKLLFRDSPSLGQPSSSSGRGMHHQYGRIF